MSDKKRSKVVPTLTALTILGAAVFWLLQPSTPSLPPLPPVTIAVPLQSSSAPLLVASAQGLFNQAGVEVISQPFVIGRDALKSVLDGKADLAVVADTPVVFAALGGIDIAVVSGISNSRHIMALVARNDRGINGLEDLAGKSIALTPGTNLPYFLDAMLQFNKIPIDAVKRVELSTAEVISAIKQGQVDAAVMFQPFLVQVQTDMGDSLKTFYGESLFSYRYLMVGKVDYIDGHPQEIQRVLRALLAANQSIATDLTAARQIVSAAIKLDDALLASWFDPGDFSLALTQSILLAMDDQTRWAMAQGLAKSGPVPNYLKLMKYKHLDAVLPEAVQIVH